MDNLLKNPSETDDLAAQHPNVVGRLQKLAEQGRADLGDSALKVVGKNVRPSGMVENPRHLNDADSSATAP